MGFPCLTEPLEKRDLPAPEGLVGFAERLFAAEADGAQPPPVLGEVAQRSPRAASGDPGGDGAEAAAQCWRAYFGDRAISRGPACQGLLPDAKGHGLAPDRGGARCEGLRRSRAIEPGSGRRQSIVSLPCLRFSHERPRSRRRKSSALVPDERCTRAAEELFVTAGAVTHPVKALQKKLGAKLFEASARASAAGRSGDRISACLCDGLDRIGCATKIAVPQRGLGDFPDRCAASKVCSRPIACLSRGPCRGACASGVARRPPRRAASPLG